MPLDRLNPALTAEVAALEQEGRAKAPERIITDYVAARGGRGPRYRLAGSDLEFLRMNSNSYLSLSNHPEVLAAADQAAHRFGAGPGAAAYTTTLGVGLTLTTKGTYWIGDALNHNCIIRAMRIANVPRERRAIYRHNDMEHLEECLQAVPDGTDRVVVIFDGIFSMRGDFAPLDRIDAIARRHHERFPEGVVTVMDDSHGIGAYGATGRGTDEHCGVQADVMTGTFGKAFGVNGGFVAGSAELVDAIRQKADTYIYTNPLGAADAAAALAAVQVADSPEGRERLANLEARTQQFRDGLDRLGLESIPGPHPVVPLLVRDTAKARVWVQALYERGVLAVALTFPVVPKGDETIRFQVNADHTEADIEDLLSILGELSA
jgi:glycine C-acetyltransferase